MKILNVTTAAEATYSQAYHTVNMGVEGLDSYAVQAVIDVDPAASTTARAIPAASVDTSADTLTFTAHGYSTGLKGQFTTSGGLPAGLNLATDYFIIRTSANAFKVATSLVNAQAGTGVDITTQGTGNHTFTPTALAGASIKLQESNDGTNWDDVSGSSSNITVDADIWVSQTSVRAQYLRTYLTMTAGHISASLALHCKGAG